MDTQRELDLLRESWTETFDQLFVLYEVAREVSSVLELDALLEHIISHASVFLESEAAAILLKDLGTGGLTLRVIKCEKSFEKSKKPVTLKAGEGIAGEAAASGKPVIFSQELSAKLFSADAVIFGGKIQTPKNLIAVPIILRGGEVIGVIEFVGKKKGTYNSKDRDFLMAIANISALSIENSKMYAKLKNDESYQAQVIECLPEGFIAVNNDGKITHINSYAVKQLGLAVKEVFNGQECSKVLKGEQELLGYLRDTLNDGKIQKWKEISLKNNGKMVYLFTFIFKDNDDKKLGAGAIFQDMLLKRG